MWKYHIKVPSCLHRLLASENCHDVDGKQTPVAVSSKVDFELEKVLVLWNAEKHNERDWYFYVVYIHVCVECECVNQMR